MNIDKPPWVAHGDGDSQPIFSVDIDSKRQRLATASQDTKIKIWSVGPLTSTAAESDDKSYPKLLATLIDHAYPVNAVRFSPNGRLLASCSDDQTAALYEQKPGVGMALGEKPNLENWKLICRLKGHSNNVMDIAWSPGGQKLVTCSLDNTAIVWSTSGRQIAVLEGHKSYVKGAAWDPIGTYVATQSDDRSIRLWRCSDWRAITSITSPFDQNFITSTFSLRLSWSPDGCYLTGTNMFDPPQHGVTILERGVWKADLTAMGHKAPVTVISYSPVLYHSRNSSDPDYCYALGSQDRKVTIWQSGADKPLAVLMNVFSQSVTDLAWSSDGLILVASSTDGSVAVFKFDANAFGRPFTPTEKQAFIDGKYGGGGSTTTGLIEDVAMLEFGGQAPAKLNGKGVNGMEAATRQLQPQPVVRPSSGATQQVMQSDKAKSLGQRTGLGSAGGFTPQPQRIAPVPVQAASQPAHQTPGALTPTGPVQRGRIEASRAQPLPQVPKAITVRLGVDELLGFTTEVSLNIANAAGSATVTCQRGTSLHWRDQIKGGIVAACGNLNFSAIATQAGSLYIYSAAGRRLVPQILLPGAPRFLCASKSSWLLMAVMLTDQSVRMWDLQSSKLLQQASIRQFQGIQVVAAKLTDSGCPLVYLLDGSAHLLHSGLQEWLTVSHPDFAASPFISRLPATSGELAQIEQQSTARSQQNPFTAPSGPGLNRRHLEAKVASALALGSAEEYSNWLLAYTHLLSVEGLEAALKEVCTELLGPLRMPKEDSVNGPSWQSSVLGLQKHDLLRSVLQDTAQQRKHQRLVADFSEQLKAAEEIEPEAMLDE